MTFLDLSVRQIEHLNEVHKVNVPLILMNSFNTDLETQRIIQKYQNHNIKVSLYFGEDLTISKRQALLFTARHLQPEPLPSCRERKFVARPSIACL